MALPRNWERSILHGIGAPATPANLRFLDEWHLREGGGDKNDANFNPLNTTQGAAGAGSINSVGVKSYRSGGQGIRATVQTLLNGHYGDIVGGLRSGHATDAQLASSPGLRTWGTGTWAAGKGVPGALHFPVAHSAPSAGGPAPSGPSGSYRAAVAQYLIDSSQALASGQQPDAGSLLQLALARQQAGATHDAFGPAPTKTSRPLAAPPTNYSGKLRGEDPGFIHKLNAAIAAVGGTQTRFSSTERSPSHNAAVGGVSGSNHLPDARGYAHAVDGETYIPGRGWVPLGVALKPVARKFGLRSGDQPGFYHGGVDVVHVDDGYNQR